MGGNLNFKQKVKKQTIAIYQFGINLWWIKIDLIYSNILFMF